jgi:hypothetical protein
MHTIKRAYGDHSIAEYRESGEIVVYLHNSNKTKSKSSRMEKCKNKKGPQRRAFSFFSLVKIIELHSIGG